MDFQNYAWKLSAQLASIFKLANHKARKLRPQVSEIALDGHISCDHIKFVPGKIKTGYIRGHLPGIPDPT